jgi:glycerophosphoryl diester phosphodiesterase
LIAHRGAGKLAPENTLAALDLGAAHGLLMFECDVKLSADGVPFLLHDADLERTTNGQGSAGALTWAQLQALDAGAWHSAPFAGERLATLEQVARRCIASAHALNIEIKPTPGTERHTGTVVAQQAQQLWSHALPLPLLTSFQTEALDAARVAAPSLPRGLLLDALQAGWLDTAQQLGCMAIVCQHKLWTAHTMAQAQQAGFRTLAYTVNRPDEVARLLALGIDGIITDRVDLFGRPAYGAALRSIHHWQVPHASTRAT